MYSDPAEETSNWSKGSLGITITKTALCNHIINTWKRTIKSWDEDEIDHIPEFLQEIGKDRCVFEKEGGNNNSKMRWKMKCECQLCKNIFDNLRQYHGHDSRKIVWNPAARLDDKRHSFLEKVQKVSRQTFVELFFQRCFICKENNCPFERNRNGVPLFEEMSGRIDENYWQLANMYMFRGKERNIIPNTGPEDTEAVLIFKMMKNCTLFNLGNEEYDDVYDDLIEVRNILMHNADQRLSDDALDECFTRMETLLKAEPFRNDEYCRKALFELSKLKDLMFITSSLTNDHKQLIQSAFDQHQQSLEWEISVNSPFNKEFNLEGILKVSKQKSQSGYYTNKTESTSHKSHDADYQGNTKTVLGSAATGAAIGTATAGPVGAAVGAIVGALFAKQC